MKTILFFIISCAFLNSNKSSAQSITTDYAIPKIYIEINAAYSFPTGSLHGKSFSEFYDFTNYSMNSGFQTSLKLKYPFISFKYSQLNVCASLGYSYYTNTDNSAYDIEFVEPGWPENSLYGENPPEKINGYSEARINIPFVGIGLDYTLVTDLNKISSFSTGFDINLSNIYGKFNNFKSDGIENHLDINSNYRLGVSFYLQNNLRFSKYFGISAGTRLMFHNLLLKNSKKSEEAGVSYLNDNADPSLNTYLINNRLISSFNFYLGFIFYY